MRTIIAAAIVGLFVVGISTTASAQACEFAYPVGDNGNSPAPLSNNHPVNGMNLPSYGAHLGADFWSGGNCTDYGQNVYAVADGEVAEIVDSLGSYLDVVVIRHDVPDLGNVYSMYGHISREAGLSEGQTVTRRQKIGFIDDVLNYFSPCHLHFELLNESAYQNGPFCNGCANAGYHVSPGYDQQSGVNEGTTGTGDRYLEVVNDGIAGNRWYFVTEFIDARIGAVCGAPDYSLSSVTVPDRLHRDATSAQITLQLKNSGTLSWVASDNFRLASTGENQLLWEGDGYCNNPTDCRINLPSDVHPGETVDLTFTVKVPQDQLSQANGTKLTLGFHMVKDGDASVGFFGPQERLDITLCERAEDAACEGDPPTGNGDDAGSTAPDAGSSSDDGGGGLVDPPMSSEDAGEQSSNNGTGGSGGDEESTPIRGEGAACATGPGNGGWTAIALALLVLLLAPIRRQFTKRRLPVDSR